MTPPPPAAEAERSGPDRTDPTPRTDDSANRTDRSRPRLVVLAADDAAACVGDTCLPRDTAE